MTAYTVTVRRTGFPPIHSFAIGTSSAAVGELIAARYSDTAAPAITIHPLNRSRK
ncbi:MULTISPECIES: hypothetical protein [unclassified Duganella]|uniref:hypothetical protein n=1 Tax=unclassified Duganella TaxID=2636909 RepID=UPI0008822857|nr:MULTISPECIES: hypothetical protein [unclassified Duganella]SDH41627.1 hypothetical protein SAMN05216320_11324 [Duganella sp. OV458]SDK60740.1 hypothetical protein SAMN05428973_113139 [Duganella sp. OV510]